MPTTHTGTPPADNHIRPCHLVCCDTDDTLAQEVKDRRVIYGVFQKVEQLISKAQAFMRSVYPWIRSEEAGKQQLSPTRCSLHTQR